MPTDLSGLDALIYDRTYTLTRRDLVDLLVEAVERYGRYGSSAEGPRIVTSVAEALAAFEAKCTEHQAPTAEREES